MNDITTREGQGGGYEQRSFTTTKKKCEQCSYRWVDIEALELS